MIIINLNDIDVNNLHYDIIKEEKNKYNVKTSYNINGDLYQDFMIRLSSKKLLKNSSYCIKYSETELKKMAQIKSNIKTKLQETFSEYHKKFFSGNLAEFEIKYTDLDKEKLYINDYQIDKNDKDSYKNLSKFCDIFLALNIEIKTRFINNTIVEIYDDNENIKNLKNSTLAGVYTNLKIKLIKEVNFTKEDFKNNYEIIRVKDSYSTVKKLEI